MRSFGPNQHADFESLRRLRGGFHHHNRQSMKLVQRPGGSPGQPHDEAFPMARLVKVFVQTLRVLPGNVAQSSSVLQGNSQLMDPAPPQRSVPEGRW